MSLTRSETVQKANSIINIIESFCSNINQTITILDDMGTVFAGIKIDIEKYIIAADVIANSTSKIDLISKKIDDSIDFTSSVIRQAINDCNTYIDKLEYDFNVTLGEDEEVLVLPKLAYDANIKKLQVKVSDQSIINKKQNKLPSKKNNYTFDNQRVTSANERRTESNYNLDSNTIITNNEKAFSSDEREKGDLNNSRDASYDFDKGNTSITNANERRTESNYNLDSNTIITNNGKAFSNDERENSDLNIIRENSHDFDKGNASITNSSDNSDKSSASITNFSDNSDKSSASITNSSDNSDKRNNTNRYTSNNSDIINNNNSKTNNTRINRNRIASHNISKNELYMYLDNTLKENLSGIIDSANIPNWDKYINVFLSNAGIDQYINTVSVKNKLVSCVTNNNQIIQFDNVSSIYGLIDEIKDYFGISK